MKIYFAIGSNIKKSSPEVRSLLTTGAQRVLYSFAVVHGKEDIYMPWEDVILDSGAFSVATGTEKISLAGYSLWLQIYLSKYPSIRAYPLDANPKSDRLRIWEFVSLFPLWVGWE